MKSDIFFRKSHVTKSAQLLRCSWLQWLREEKERRWTMTMIRKRWSGDVEIQGT